MRTVRVYSLPVYKTAYTYPRLPKAGVNNLLLLRHPMDFSEQFPSLRAIAGRPLRHMRTGGVDSPMTFVSFQGTQALS